jgi:hypothetical protein
MRLLHTDKSYIQLKTLYNIFLHINCYSHNERPLKRNFEVISDKFNVTAMFILDSYACKWIHNLHNY